MGTNTLITCAELATVTKRQSCGFLYLLGGLVEGHRCVDQLEPVLHFQHELLPVRGHVLGTLSDQVHVVVVGLEQSLGLLLDLQGTLVGFLPRGESDEEKQQ